jgi:hypothetical protein
MSYKLRSKTKHNQTTVGESILPSADAGSSTRDASTHPSPSAPATRSYSDVVAASSPPSSPDGIRKSSDNLLEREGALDASVNVGTGLEPSDTEDASGDTSSFISNQEDNGQPWIEVKPRRSRSLDSLKRNKVTFLKHAKSATRDQRDPVLEAAEKSLTPDQRERIRKRRTAVRTRSGSNSSRGEGTSQAKGKGPDPRDWGNVNIDPEELDAEKQKRQIEHYNLRKKYQVSSE